MAAISTSPFGSKNRKNKARTPGDRMTVVAGHVVRLSLAHFVENFAAPDFEARGLQTKVAALLRVMRVAS
jgi:hypothetical protein